MRNIYPAVTEDQIENFESVFSVRLPHDYRKFLLENNGGVPDCIYYIKDGADVVLNEFLPMKFGMFSIEGYLNDFEFHKQQLVPIAEDMFGNILLIDCTSVSGKIFTWNHETTSISYVAEGFNYFLNNLQSEFEE